MSVPSLTQLQIPVSGNYQGYEGKAYYAGLQIMKPQRISWQFRYQGGMYYPCDTRVGDPYRGAPRGSGTIDKAYINSIEWLLAFGKSSGEAGLNGTKFDPSQDYGVTGNYKLADMISKAGLIDTSVKFASDTDRPIKFDMVVKVNTDGIPNLGSDAYYIQATLIGCMMNTIGISVGTGADLVQIGPLPFSFENVELETIKVT